MFPRCSLDLEGSWKGNGGVGVFFDQVSYYINVFFDNFGSGRTCALSYGGI